MENENSRFMKYMLPTGNENFRFPPDEGIPNISVNSVKYRYTKETVSLSITQEKILILATYNF